MKSSGWKLRHICRSGHLGDKWWSPQGASSVKVRKLQHSRREPKERDPPIHLGNSKSFEGRQGGEWGSWRPGAQALTAQGVACLLQRSWRERAPNATWGPLPELCYVLKDGEAALWEWWPKHGSRGRI